MRYFNTVKPIKIVRSKGRERSFPREEKEISREASWDIRNSPLSDVLILEPNGHNE